MPRQHGGGGGIKNARKGGFRSWKTCVVHCENGPQQMLWPFFPIFPPLTQLTTNQQP